MRKSINSSGLKLWEYSRFRFLSSEQYINLSETSFTLSGTCSGRGSGGFGTFPAKGCRGTRAAMFNDVEGVEKYTHTALLQLLHALRNKIVAVEVVPPIDTLLQEEIKFNIQQSLLASCLKNIHCWVSLFRLLLRILQPWNQINYSSSFFNVICIVGGLKF